MLNKISADAMNSDLVYKLNELSGHSNENSKVLNFSQDIPSEQTTDTCASEIKPNDLSEQSDDSKICCVSQEENPSSDNMLNETVTAAQIINVQDKTSEMSIVLHKGISQSDRVLDDTYITMNSQEELCKNSKENISNDISNVSQEDNSTSEVVLDETDTDAEINIGPQEETSNISEKIDINEISRTSEEDNVLNETDKDATKNDSQEIPEQIENKKVLQEDHLTSDSVPNETDTDASIHDSQEEIIDMKTYGESDKTDAVLHEKSEIDNKTINPAHESHENLITINKDDHENSVAEPQIDRNIEETKKINVPIPTDEPSQGIENTTLRKHDKLVESEIRVEKSVLPKNYTQVQKENNETQKLTEKELIWETKSIEHEPKQQEKIELLQKEITHEQNVIENQNKKNMFVRAAPLEDVQPPMKRTRFEPVWTTNTINEDKPKATQALPFQEYLISDEVKKELQYWILKTGIAQPKSKYMLRLVNDARWNRAVLRMSPIPKHYKQMNVFGIIRYQIKIYEKDIVKNIQFIHIHRYNENFNAAYIKWRDIDKLLVVKAYQILVTTSFTVDGTVKQPLFKYDDRLTIDWDVNDRPIILNQRKEDDMEIPKAVNTSGAAPVAIPTATSVPTIATSSGTSVATSLATAVATDVATAVATPVATFVSAPLRKPPPAFINGKINIKDEGSYGLTQAFMKFYKLKPPIASFVFVKNLDMSQSVDRYHRIFSAAGHIAEIEVMAPQRCGGHQSMKLRILYHHALEAVQAISMFHENILDDRIIEIEIGDITMKKRPFNVEGFSSLGPGLGVNGYVMRNIRSNLELSKLRSRTKAEFVNLKGQIGNLRLKLVKATLILEQVKKDAENRKIIERKIQTASLNQQANIDAVSAMTTAIASSIQANVIGLLGIQPNQQGVMPLNHSPSTPVNFQPVSMHQIQNTPVNWISSENTATTFPNQNMFVKTNTETAFHNAVNMQSNSQGYQKPNNPQAYFARVQQIYKNLDYTMDPHLIQASADVQPSTYMSPANSNMQPAISHMQPAISNMQPGIANMPPGSSIPLIGSFNMPPTTSKTQPKPTNISDLPVPLKTNDPTQSKVPTQSKTVFSPLPTTKNVTVDIHKPSLHYDVPPASMGQKTAAPSRFDVPPDNVGKTTAAGRKVPDVALPIPTNPQPSIKMAFKMQKPLQPPKVTKPTSINIKIPAMLPETVPVVLPNPRTQDKNKIKLMKIAEKLPKYQKPVEPWINKQIKDMRRNSKSPERIRKSPEKIQLPDRSQKTKHKAIELPIVVRRNSMSPVRRISRSPIKRNSSSTERRRMSRSPVWRKSRSTERRKSRSPIRRKSRSTERRQMSRSPKRRISRSPIRRKSRSPQRRNSRSPRRRISRSPIRRKSRSPVRRRSRSPIRRKSRSPIRRKSRSPMRRRNRSSERRRISRSPKRRISRSPMRRISRSPKRRISRSPIRRISRSPKKSISRSPMRRISRSPKRETSQSPVRRTSKSPLRRKSRSSETKGISRSRSPVTIANAYCSGQKPTIRPAYESDGASRDIMNLNLGDQTAIYNYTQVIERESANTLVSFNFLPPSVTKDDLQDKMSEIGELLEVRVFGRGQAIVAFKLGHDAE